MSAVTAQHLEHFKVNTVDQWLEDVSYELDPTYIPSIFALEMVNFIKLVNGVEGEENKTPVLHMKMLDQIASGERNIANLVYRGAAKSTLMEYIIFYIAVYGELPNFCAVSFILYVSDSIENGVKTMRKSLEYRWQNSDFLQRYLPKTRFTDVRWDFWNKADQKLTVRGYGAKTGVRGTREAGSRPQLAMLDDLVSDEDARSATVIASIEDTIYKAIDYALHPKHRMIIWNGTPFNQNDPLYKGVESGAWAVNVYPVCERFPCEEEDFRGAWPDRHDYSYVLAQYKKAKLAGKLDSFMQELMLRITSDEDRLIRDNDINWFEGKDLQNHLDNYNFYITTDFATSEKARADYSVMSVWAYNSNDEWMLYDGNIGRNLMDRNIDVLFDMVVKYDVKQVGVEVTGQQGAFVTWIRKEMHRRNIYFTIIEVRPVSDKMRRLHTVVPLFRQGKIWFNKDMIGTKFMDEALNEISRATISQIASRHDDFLDTVSMIPEMSPWKPSSGTGWDIEESSHSVPSPFGDNISVDEVLPIGSYII